MYEGVLCCVGRYESVHAKDGCCQLAGASVSLMLVFELWFLAGTWLGLGIAYLHAVK